MNAIKKYSNTNIKKKSNHTYGTLNQILVAVLLLFSSTLFAQWVQQADPPGGKHHPISFALNGKGYAVTGTASNGVNTDDVYEYDPVTDSWTTLSDFPGVARSFGIGAVTNGIAYLGFGATSSSYLNDFWSYDATSNTWTQLADCGCSGRRHPALVAIGDRVYVGLGDDATGNRNDWWMYDINENTWTRIDNLPGQTRHHPFMFKAGNKVYAGLGHGAFGIYNDWYMLDTASNSWTAMNNFPGEARVAGTQFDAGGNGFVLSGDGDNHSFMSTGEMWRYSPSADAWTMLTPHPGQSRWAPGSFVIDNSVYFFGGLNRFTNQFPTDLWKFDLSTFVGIDERVLTNTYVYPNPAHDFIYWENDQSITDVKIYNTLGQFFSMSTAEKKQIDTRDLDNGLYLIQFYDNNTLVKTSKILIQH